MLQLARVTRSPAARLLLPSTWLAASSIQGYATVQTPRRRRPTAKRQPALLPTSCQAVLASHALSDLPPIPCQPMPAGDKVEEGPRARTLKPDKEQPAAQDINQAERVVWRTGRCRRDEGGGNGARCAAASRKWQR